MNKKRMKLLIVFFCVFLSVYTQQVVCNAKMSASSLNLQNIDGSLYLKWNNYDKNCTYSLWRSEQPNSGYKCVRNCINKNFVKILPKADKRYYYKVRPYILVNKKKIYGRFSNMCPGNMDVTVVLFVGQSNMAGRGDDLTIAPKVELNSGWEFRAISDPTKLYRIVEPFGKYENNPNGLNDLNKKGKPAKNGSMVSMVANVYFENTGTPIVGVSASKGGKKIHCFEPGTKMYADMEERLKSCLVYLECNGYNVEHIYMAWLQGEADTFTSTEQYEKSFRSIVDQLHDTCDVEMCFVSLVSGSYKSDGSHIRNALEDVCRDCDYCTLSSTSAQYFYESGLLRSDEIHYKQEALNIVGEEMGTTMSEYTNSLKR